MADRTFLDLQEEVLAHGFDPGVYRPRIKRWLNDAVRRLRRRLEIADNLTESTINTVAGLATYPLPADFVRLAREDTVGALRVVEAGADRQLTEITLRQFDDLDESTSGSPTHFALEEDSALVWPSPAAIETLGLRYWAGAPPMSADTDVPDIPDEYAELAVSYALSRAYKGEDDPEMALFHFGEWERDQGRMAADMQHRTDRPRQVPGMLGVWGDEPIDEAMIR